MWERLRRFSALEPPARNIFLRAAALLPLISLSLRLRGFRKTQAHLQGHFSGKIAAPDASSRSECVAVTARMVRAAVHHGLGRSTCLEESLALWFLLGWQGIASQVRIGIRKDSRKFEAHAWIECDGVALSEPEENHHHFSAFDASLSALPPEGK
jgi:hypothetical protein